MSEFDVKTAPAQRRSDDAVVHIVEAPKRRGEISERYDCFGCGVELGPVKGSKMAHHWRHYPERDQASTARGCSGESKDHRATKEYVAAQRLFRFKCHICKKWVEIASDSGETETDVGEWRFDVVLWRDGEPILIVEVCRSSAMKKDKIDALNESKIPWVEIESLERGGYSLKAMRGEFSCVSARCKSLADLKEAFEFDGEGNFTKRVTDYILCVVDVPYECVRFYNLADKSGELISETHFREGESYYDAVRRSIAKVKRQGVCHCGAIEIKSQRGNMVCFRRCWITEGGQDACRDCGATLATNKRGQPYCSDGCWIKDPNEHAKFLINTRGRRLRAEKAIKKAHQDALDDILNKS